ncbi:hypothetical protein [Paenibacillus sp. Marseille-Q4541]|uniref:hypothetical protein n=1 Tax=Paenibacillus sp. Marseille-Q4541 TaxID=2831522 RepID=UPI001BA55353|nr:hypothetical protein [Paenibacillus sp. Marseille-Q4541]
MKAGRVATDTAMLVAGIAGYESEADDAWITPLDKNYNVISLATIRRTSKDPIQGQRLTKILSIINGTYS